jgi:3-hydroxybutyryl-CoA dehydrogenase
MAGERVAVVGAGLMGHGIAQVFAAAGRPVAVWDPDPVARTSVAARVGANLRATGRGQDVLERLHVRDSLEDAVGDADVVIEAAPEDLPLKQELFERLDQLAPAGAMLATNTSVMSVGEIGARAKRRERVLGTHWWNPPYLIPLVEVVRAEATAEEVVRRMMELLAEVGKTPVHVRRDVPGFVGNRLQHALWREAIAIVAAGICDAETVDTVVKNADLVGLDLTLAIHEYVLPHLDRSPGPSPLLRDKVAHRDLGMKTGTGFHHWPPGTPDALRARLLEFLVEQT